LKTAAPQSGLLTGSKNSLKASQKTCIKKLKKNKNKKIKKLTPRKDAHAMKFSLIMATCGRSGEVALFLDALRAQTWRNFELILMDQNEDSRVETLYHEYKDKISIQYHHNHTKGLSLNRNAGLAYAAGDIIAFPDDDCLYEADTLEKARRFFTENPLYGLYVCNTRDGTRPCRVVGGAEAGGADISLFNIFNLGISFTIFVRAGALGRFRFDERMGLGAAFGSGEESDLLLYLLKNKIRGRYQGDCYIYHPAKADTPERAYSYGRGFGAVYKKAVMQYHFFIMLPIFFLRIAKGVLNIMLCRDKKIRLYSLRGRIEGFIRYKTGPGHG
jgi:glycosyltransferase involved in cell wall biosynthesis